jgi:hypothetical protein
MQKAALRGNISVYFELLLSPTRFDSPLTTFAGEKAICTKLALRVVRSDGTIWQNDLHAALGRRSRPDRRDEIAAVQ